VPDAIEYGDVSSVSVQFEWHPIEVCKFTSSKSVDRKSNFSKLEVEES